jgi:hypothetical protein
LADEANTAFTATIRLKREIIFWRSSRAFDAAEFSARFAPFNLAVRARRRVFLKHRARWAGRVTVFPVVRRRRGQIAERV